MKKQEKFITDFGLLRRKAKKKLKMNTLKELFQLSEVDTLRLIHELEKHQIELEMQNEELIKQKAYGAELGRKKYNELYDFVPSGFFTLSHEGKLLGKERLHLINSMFGFFVFISIDIRAIFNQFLGKIFKSRTKEMPVTEIISEKRINLYV